MNTLKSTLKIIKYLYFTALTIILAYFSPALSSYYVKRDEENNNTLKKQYIFYKVCLETYFYIKERLRNKWMKFCKREEQQFGFLGVLQNDYY